MAKLCPTQKSTNIHVANKHIPSLGQDYLSQKSICKVLVQTLIPQAHIPKRENSGTVVFTVQNIHVIKLPPFSVTKVYTAIAYNIVDPSAYLRKAPHNNLSIKSISVEGGGISSNHRGEITILLKNNSPSPFKIK